MDWKDSLDKYLTTEPQDNFEDWCEDVVNSFSDTFYNKNEHWIEESSGQCNKWFNKLYDKDRNSNESALIIQRAFDMYLKKK
jgi:hypothetical protein